MIFLAFLFSLITLASPPGNWEFANSIVERHEFYENGEEIKKPANSWQTLFALIYLDSNFQQTKECIFFRVPGEEPGKLKSKKVRGDKECVLEALSDGEREWSHIQSLSFTINAKNLALKFRMNDRLQEWFVPLKTSWSRPDARLLLSSADFKGERMIYLLKADTPQRKIISLREGEICHDITPDCLEKSASRCRLCKEGWMEIPNGCMTGPKVCGKGECGGKGMPACRRGIVWQRKDAQYDCRTDSSFAWCSDSFQVVCDGDKAYCN